MKGVPEQLTDMLALVESYQPGRLGTSLTDKLTTVMRFLDASKLRQASENLDAFINQVKSQSGSGLTADQAAELVMRAERIKLYL